MLLFQVFLIRNFKLTINWKAVFDWVNVTWPFKGAWFSLVRSSHCTLYTQQWAQIWWRWVRMRRGCVILWARFSLSGCGISWWWGTWSSLDSSKSSRTLHTKMAWLWLPSPLLVVLLHVESGSKLSLHYRVCVTERVLLCDAMDTWLKLF